MEGLLRFNAAELKRIGKHLWRQALMAREEYSPENMNIKRFCG